MVTPMNERYLEIPSGVRTRMILHLLPNCDRVALRKEFESLPDTLLLFLEKLKKLSIRISIPGTPEVDLTYSRESLGNRVSIHNVSTCSNSVSIKNFWIKRRPVTDLPYDDARDENREAEIVLAFPLNANEVPIIDNQHVSAFLPLRKVGYKVSQCHLLYKFFYL